MNLQNLGLAYRAKKVTLGTDYVVEKLRAGKIFLIILASDASELTKKKINDKAKTYQVDVLDSATTEEISSALGRANIKVVGITDRGLSHLIR